jgi:hypothetical protein
MIIGAQRWCWLQGVFEIVLNRDQFAGHIPVDLSTTLRSAFLLPDPIRARSYALFVIGHDESPNEGAMKRFAKSPGAPDLLLPIVHGWLGPRCTLY